MNAEEEKNIWSTPDLKKYIEEKNIWCTPDHASGVNILPSVHVICVNEFQNRIPITAAYQGQNARTLWYSTGMLWCGMVLCNTRQVRAPVSAGL